MDQRARERNVLFNNTLNTFYIRLYGIGHMVKDHSDSERGNLLPPHGLLFPISSKGSFIWIIPDGITHTTTFVTPVVEHWQERRLCEDPDVRTCIETRRKFFKTRSTLCVSILWATWTRVEFTHTGFHWFSLTVTAHTNYKTFYEVHKDLLTLIRPHTKIS